MQRARITIYLLGLFILLGTKATYGEDRYDLAWKMSTTGAWPPAVVDGKIIIKNADLLTAYTISEGKKVWRTKIPNLRYGEGVLTASEDHIYVLGEKGVHVLHPDTGKNIGIWPVPGPQSLLYHNQAVYVSGRDGIYRFVAGSGKLLQKGDGASGEIRAANGRYVALFVQHRETDGKASPKRIIVIDLKSNKQIYEFKLLPMGWHRVVSFGQRTIAFIDFSQRTGKGRNPKKLFYTEADFHTSKKLKDISLSDKYSAWDSDVFWIVANEGFVYLGNHGNPGRPSSLSAYDPSRRESIWTRSGDVLGMGLILHKGLLWTGSAKSNREAFAVAYNPKDGNTVFQHPLDAPGTGAPVGWGRWVVLRTRGSLYCFTPNSQKTPIGEGDASPSTEGTRPGWRLFKDSKAGYYIQMPPTWSFDKAGMRRLGGLRFVIPFMRKNLVNGRTATLGTINIMTWEVTGEQSGRDVWNAVYAQQRKLHRDLTLMSAKEISNVAGTGQPGLLAEYTFRNRQRFPVQLRSLCLVHHGIAFELRGWAGPFHPQEVWQEVEQIFSTFRPQAIK